MAQILMDNLTSKMAAEAPVVTSLETAGGESGWAKHSQLSLPTSRSIFGSSNKERPLSSHWPEPANMRNFSFTGVL